MNNEKLTGEEIGMIICQALEKYEAKKRITLLNREAVANRLKVSMSTLWRWNKSGYLRAIKYGRAVWYRLDDIEAFESGEKTITEIEEDNEYGAR